MGAPKELADDWKTLQPRGKPKKPKKVVVDDIHEDWAVLKGAKYPPYAYWVWWPRVNVLIIWKMAVLGKRKENGYVIYQARKVKVVYKTPGYQLDEGDKEDTRHTSFTRGDLCFDREEVEKTVDGLRNDFIYKALHEVQRVTDALAKEHKYLQWNIDQARTLTKYDFMPHNVLTKIPRRASKRLAEPEPATLQGVDQPAPGA